MMDGFISCQKVLVLLLCCTGAIAIEVNLSSIDSVKSVASTLVYDMMSIYQGNLSGQTPGLLPGPPYYWWEAGAMWGTLIDYWFYTNDSSYNNVVEQALLFQTGVNNDFLPGNQTLGMGNDDQGFWGLSAMTAAELNFQNPPSSSPQWLGLAQAVFNEYVTRYQQEYETCGGGLRWQVYFFSVGWTYKNSISNGCFFNLGARLALYTGNSSYAVWAEKVWDWVETVGLMELQPYTNASKHFGIDGTGAGGYIIWDGTRATNNCSGVNHIPYSYNAAIFLYGAAVMYNYTNGSEIWANRTQLMLNATLNAFLPDGIAIEVACERNLSSCDTDMLSFKAYLTRWMAITAQLAEFTKPQIMPALAKSATAAAQQCSGGANGRMCGMTWVNGSKWDGSQGVGQQMAATEVILSNIIHMVKPPLKSSTGATSVGNPNAGLRASPASDPWLLWTPSRGDRAGAGILTILMSAGALWFFVWMAIPEKIPDSWKTTTPS